MTCGGESDELTERLYIMLVNILEWDSSFKHKKCVLGDITGDGQGHQWLSGFPHWKRDHNLLPLPG